MQWRVVCRALSLSPRTKRMKERNEGRDDAREGGGGPSRVKETEGEGLEEPRNSIPAGPS